MKSYKFPVHLHSHRLGEHLWLVRNETELNQVPRGEAAIFLSDVPNLRGKSDDELRVVLEGARVFRGMRVQA